MSEFKADRVEGVLLNIKTKACLKCGNFFQTTLAAKKYCSPECRQAAKEARGEKPKPIIDKNAPSPRREGLKRYRFRQIKYILTRLTYTGSPKTKLIAGQMLRLPLPRLNGHREASAEQTFHRVAANDKVFPHIRFMALRMLIEVLAEKELSKLLENRHTGGHPIPTPFSNLLKTMNEVIDRYSLAEKSSTPVYTGSPLLGVGKVPTKKKVSKLLGDPDFSLLR